MGDGGGIKTSAWAKGVKKRVGPFRQLLKEVLGSLGLIEEEGDACFQRLKAD